MVLLEIFGWAKMEYAMGSDSYEKVLVARKFVNYR
jgi:hypothetical protein